MKRKKTLKYLKRFSISLLILFTILVPIGALYMNHLGSKIYGGLTERVNSDLFKPQTGSFGIKNVNLLSANGERIIENQTILIENGHISDIDSSLTFSSDIRVIDGKGKYLIPGLIDAHVHLFKSPNDLLLYLANGVTEIRELIGEKDHLQWKQEIEAGRIGPKMHVFSPRIGSFETKKGWMMSYTQGYVNIKNAQEAREMIQGFYNEGYDGIKIYSQVNEEAYIAINQIAKTLGMPVVGHIPWALQFDDIWKHGQTDIVHFEELMNALGREFHSERMIGAFKGKEEEFLQFIEQRSPRLAQNLIENDISITSTLWLTSSFKKQPFEIEKILGEVAFEYVNPGISEWSKYIPQGLGWLPEVHRYKLPPNQTKAEFETSKKYWGTYANATRFLAENMIKHGVKIMAGTDANLPPTVPGFSLHDELTTLNSVGLSNIDVLKAATQTPATLLKSNSGKISEGYEANLILLNKNPLENIAHTKTINTVIMRGQVFNRDLLDQMLNAVIKANDNSRTVDIKTFKQTNKNE